MHYCINMGFSLTSEQAGLISHRMGAALFCLCELQKNPSQLIDLRDCLDEGIDFCSLEEIALSISSSDSLRSGAQLAQAIADTLGKPIPCFYWFPTGYRCLQIHPS